MFSILFKGNYHERDLAHKNCNMLLITSKVTIEIDAYPYIMPTTKLKTIKRMLQD